MHSANPFLTNFHVLISPFIHANKMWHNTQASSHLCYTYFMLTMLFSFTIYIHMFLSFTLIRQIVVHIRHLLSVQTLLCVLIRQERTYMCQRSSNTVDSTVGCFFLHQNYVLIIFCRSVKFIGTGPFVY